MLLRSSAVGLMVLAGLASTGLADDSGPAPASQPAAVTEPSTNPTTAPVVPADQTTPRGAVKMFFAANIRGDGPGLQSLLLGENPAEDGLIAAMGEQKTADHDLADALQAKFPQEMKVDPAKRADEQVALVGPQIDAADEHVEGDTATVSGRGGGKPFTLKRVDGRWRIPLSVLVRNADPEKLRKATHQIDIQVKVMRDAVADVNAGKYASIQEAQQGVKQKLFMEALADHQRSTSQPATQP